MELGCTLSVNSLALCDIWNKFKYVIFQLILAIDGCGISYEIALKWMSLNLTVDKLILVQVLAWCHGHQASTSTNVDSYPCCYMASPGHSELMSPHETDHETDHCQTSNISHTLVGNIIIDHSDVVGASAVGAAPITSSSSI